MPQVLVAQVTCPNCQNQFQTPVEQVVDVKADPSAKTRLLNGLVNVAACPHCGMRGALNLPFLYHDPEKELALIHMPMEAGRDDLERQQAIGKFTSLVMESLPPEERKAYLLQPEIFLTMENLVNRVLQADGITEEMIEAQKAKADLLRRMVELESDEELEALIRENDASIDADFFRILNLNLDMAQAGGDAEGLQKLLATRDKLLEQSSEGKVVKQRNEILEALRAEPTSEKLAQLLVRAPDEATRELLVAFGRPLLDYAFFQNLTAQIEATKDADERERLKEVRAEVLETRDRMDEQTRLLYEDRQALLRDVLLSDEPEVLIQRRFPEIDQAFFNVLSANLEQAQAEGDQEAVEDLQAVWGLVLGMMESSLPPELQLFNHVAALEDEAQIEELLRENKEHVTERFLELLEEAEGRIRAQGAQDEDEEALETADHLARVLEKARELAPAERV